MTGLAIIARHFGCALAVGSAWLGVLCAILAGVVAIPALVKHSVAVALVVGIALFEFAVHRAELAKRFWRERNEA